MIKFKTDWICLQNILEDYGGDDMLSAADAKTLTIKSREEKDKDVLSDIEKEIKNAIFEGKSYLPYMGEINKNVKSVLVNLGYSVSYSMLFKGNYISWGWKADA